MTKFDPINVIYFVREVLFIFVIFDIAQSTSPNYTSVVKVFLVCILKMEEDPEAIHITNQDIKWIPLSITAEYPEGISWIPLSVAPNTYCNVYI